MSTLAEIEQAMDKLTPAELQTLLQYVTERARRDATPQPAGDRVPGMHAGQVWMADDIMDPLPDDMWEHNKA